MKNKKKILALLLCAILLVVASVAGTVAYLTDNATVNNTFTVGNVDIDMVETKVDPYGNVLTGNDAGTTDANTYKLIPGHSYTKDPTVTVLSGSEDCYIFVKIENGLGSDATLTMSEKWTEVTRSGNTIVCVYANAEGPVAVSEGESVTPFTAFTFGTDADPADYANSSITVTAYAIQADTLEDASAAELWNMLNA